MSKRKNWTGQKHFKLTFIKPTNITRSTSIVWEILCDCGKTTYSIPSNVVSGRIKSCGCLKKNSRPNSRKNYTGQKYNRLTFIKPTDERSCGGVVWELLCDCGNITYVRAASVTKKKGGTMSCGCLAKEIQQQLTYEPIISSARAAWRTYQKEIDFDTFYHMSQNNCYYCDSPPQRIYNFGKTISKRRKNINKLSILHGDFIYNGIDRIDSNKGHTLDNIVTCCTTCNMMKGIIPVQDFIIQVKRIYLYQASLSNMEEVRSENITQNYIHNFVHVKAI